MRFAFTLILAISTIEAGLHKPIVIVSDLQRTSFVERLILREQNDRARKTIIKYIAWENPAQVCLLGDLVFSGDSESDWSFYDALMAPLTAKNIPLYMVPGNHEYWGNNQDAMKLVYKRFPYLKKKHWYLQRFGRLALVYLDSNIDDLPAATWKKQVTWYKRILADLENEKKIKAIVVLMHHPPFTNSKTTSDEKYLHKPILPSFYKNKKTILFISGHAHGYERFIKNRKTFIVSGGGGGPRVKLYTSSDQRHADQYKAPAPRPFNYLLLQPTAKHLDITVKGFTKKDYRLIELEKIRLPYY